MTTEASEVARIRVSLTTGELEVEGSESFVSQYAEPIAAILEKLESDGFTPAAPMQQSAAPAPPAPGPTPQAAEDEPFGEVLHALSSKSGTDQILLAGYYVGKNASDGTFSTNDAHSLLIGQGIKLSNASQSMKNNVTAKRAFKVGSRFKVAKAGMDHLKSLGVHAA